MEQRKLTKGPLLDEDGNLIEAGYAFDLVREYHREHIKSSDLRIKEWDYYYFGNSEFGFAITVADNSYMSLVSASFLDFVKKEEHTKSYMNFWTRGTVNLPNDSSHGDILYEKKKFSFKFLNDHGKRHLVCHLAKLYKNHDFDLDIIVNRNNSKSMVISTPFAKSKHFYYNQKINCLTCNGTLKVGDRVITLENIPGVLDWGRGVWTYRNTWYWSSLSTYQDNHHIGFNLGYGFGDTSAASENMVFVDDEAYKLDDVVFNIPKNKKNKDDFLGKWTITSKNKDVDLEFTPILNRHSDSNVLVIRSNQNQVFGKFSGTITADGRVIEIKDALGFAEKVFNKW